MNEAATRKMGGVAAIVFGILFALPFLVIGDAPDFVDDPTTISEFFVENEGKLFGAGLFAMLAGFALAWFGAVLREVLGRDGGAGGSTVAFVVTIGTALTAACTTIAGAILSVGTARVSEHGAEGAASALINWDLFQVIYGGAGTIGLAVLFSAVAFVAIRGTTFVPPWLGWVSAALAVVGLIPPISWVLIVAGAAWALVVGVLLFRSASRVAV